MIGRRAVAGMFAGLAAGATGACSSNRPQEIEFPPAIEQAAQPSPVVEADTLRPPSARELYEAAVAVGAPDAVPRDTRQARELFDRLVELYPESAYAADVPAFRAFLDREEELRQQIRLLESELEQLKAIDFGQPAESGRP